MESKQEMATVQELLEVRRMRGEQIAKVEDAIQRIDGSSYKVHSQSGESWYSVQYNGTVWLCECPDYEFNGLGKCKHTFAVELSLELRRRIENARVIEPLDLQSCLYCYSKNIVRRGILHNKSGDIQRFGCKESRIRALEGNAEDGHGSFTTLLQRGVSRRHKAISRPPRREGLPSDYPQLDNEVCAIDGEILR